MSPTPISRLVTLQSKQLKYLALLTGTPIGTTKSTTASSLASHITTPQRPASKILSIDMGIKNLAYCVLTPSNHSESDGTTYKIHDWQRLNLLTPNRPSIPVSDLESETETEAVPLTFSPSVLAPVAVTLAHTLLTLKPSTILIERQRFRSGSGSAVQEWTLRVNTLEAMLWAAFETVLRSTPGKFGVREMSPQRIAGFWNSGLGDRGVGGVLTGGYAKGTGKADQEGEEDGEAKSKGARGMEKREKIALVRTWALEGLVEGDADGVGNGVGDVLSGFTGAGKLLGKKDDLADCLVQGVTFAMWERNRVELGELVETIGGEEAKVGAKKKARTKARTKTTKEDGTKTAAKVGRKKKSKATLESEAEVGS